jgi:predicted  nucleic acid-binding Zn-ribbon protein
MEMKRENMKKEILELRRELVRVEHRLRRLERELSGYSKVDEIRNELKKEFPSLEFDDDLLELVGRLPYNPVDRDKEVIREAVEWSIE